MNTDEKQVLTREQMLIYVGAIIQQYRTAYAHVGSSLDYIRDLQKQGEDVDALLEDAKRAFDALNYLEHQAHAYKARLLKGQSYKHVEDSD